MRASLLVVVVLMFVRQCVAATSMYRSAADALAMAATIDCISCTSMLPNDTDGQYLFTFSKINLSYWLRECLFAKRDCHSQNIRLT
jgi:hypothetical protein